MRRAEIARKFDEIVEFAEVEQFIDTPVKRYSSGMYLRLAFAVAAHLEPEILIVDEVLSVGDLAFQEKCLGRMENVAGEGRTVLFVSHNLTAVQSALPALDAPLGRQDDYRRSNARSRTGIHLERPQQLRERAATAPTAQGSGRFRFTSMTFQVEGKVVDLAATGSDLEVTLEYESPGDQPIRNPTFSVSFYTLLGELILNCQSHVAGAQRTQLPASGEVSLRIPKLPLPAGRYVLNVFGTAGSEVADWIQRAGELTVAEGDFFGSGQRPAESHQTVLVQQEWQFRAAEDMEATRRQAETAV